MIKILLKMYKTQQLQGPEFKFQLLPNEVITTVMEEARSI
jgi:hypothetical protein